MDGFDMLLKATAPPFTKKKGKGDPEDNPTGDDDKDKVPNALDKEPEKPKGKDESLAEEAKGDQPGESDDDTDNPFANRGELTPEEQAAAAGEGEELPPEEGAPGEEPGVDPGAQGEMSDLIMQLAAAEQKFYATKGQLGDGHHQTNGALEEMHKLVRRLAKQVAGAHGLNRDGSMLAPAGAEEDMAAPPEEEMARSLSPRLRMFVAQETQRVLSKSREVSWPPPQAPVIRAPEARAPLTMPTAPTMPAAVPQVGQAVPQQFAKSEGPHLSGPVDAASMAAQMSAPTEGLSLANYVGDPNGGSFVDWDSVMVGRMGTAPAKAGEDGYPSEIIERDGTRVTTGHGRVPGMPAARMTGESPYVGSDAGEAHPHIARTGVHMPGGEMSPPAAKMGADSWIDWGASADPRGAMPFAGEIDSMMGQMSGAPRPQAQPGMKYAASDPNGPVRQAANAPEGTNNRYPMQGKSAMLAYQEPAGRPQAPQAPALRPRQARAPQQTPAPRQAPRSSVGRTAPRAPMVGRQQRPQAPQAPALRPRGPARSPQQAPAPRQAPRATAGRTAPPAMSGRMGPQPSVPGVPLHRTEKMLVGRMAEHASTGMSGFDYAMMGRMARMEAGLPAVELQRSETRAPTLRKGEDFSFLLDMSDDFLAKAEAMLSLLED